VTSLRVFGFERDATFSPDDSQIEAAWHPHTTPTAARVGRRRQRWPLRSEDAARTSWRSSARPPTHCGSSGRRWTMAQIATVALSGEDSVVPGRSAASTPRAPHAHRRQGPTVAASSTRVHADETASARRLRRVSHAWAAQCTSMAAVRLLPAAAVLLLHHRRRARAPPVRMRPGVCSWETAGAPRTPTALRAERRRRHQQPARSESPIVAGSSTLPVCRTYDSQSTRAGSGDRFSPWSSTGCEGVSSYPMLPAQHVIAWTSTDSAIACAGVESQ